MVDKTKKQRRRGKLRVTERKEEVEEAFPFNVMLRGMGVDPTGRGDDIMGECDAFMRRLFQAIEQRRTSRQVV